MNNKLVNSIFILVSLIVVFLIAYIAAAYKKEVIFTINDSKLILKTNDVTKLDYTISDPNIEIMWHSSNPNIVSIDSNANIIAGNAGNAIITGSITDGNSNKSVVCYITVKTLDQNIALSDFNLPDGELLLAVGEIYPIPITYVPNNGYVTSVNYIIENDYVLNVEDGFMKGLSSGKTSLTIIVNNQIQKEITVNVINKEVTTHIIKPVKTIDFDINEETIYVNEEKTLNYIIEPSDADIYSITWDVDNKNILSVYDGTIKGISPGNTIVEVTVNNKIKQYVNVNVKPRINSIELKYSPKKILKVGESIKLEPTISPNQNNSLIVYESNNPSCLSVSQNGTLIANSKGNAIITIRTEDGSIKKTLSFIVYGKTGVVNNDRNIWGFSKETDVIPRRADTLFFTNLARKGKGVFSNNVYTIGNYTYDVKNSLLTIRKTNKIFMRMYYPTNKDLSTQNTFTFIGGVGEGGFGGYFSDIEKNLSLIKSSGIIILIPEHNDAKVVANNVKEATNFVKLIINQSSKARNIIGGYSNGGPMAGETANIANYDKIMLINTSFYWADTKTKLRNTEIVIYSARNDSWKGTNGFIGELYDNNFTNVTIVSNNESIIERYKSKYLVINPGNSMKNGHTSENLTLSHFFAYACD